MEKTTTHHDPNVVKGILVPLFEEDPYYPTSSPNSYTEFVTITTASDWYQKSNGNGIIFE